jgi:hypothetical protein
MSKRIAEWRFTGKKDANGVPHEYHMGIPARNLDAADVELLTDDEYKTVEASKLYVEKTLPAAPKKTSTAKASTDATSAPINTADAAASAGADAPKES